MTKKELGMLHGWYHAKARHLSDVYASWSGDKQRGYNNCNARRYSLNGFDARIPSANGWKFTYAFLFQVVNTTTGVIETWMEYDTADNIYHFFITDDSDYYDTIDSFFDGR